MKFPLMFRSTHEKEVEILRSEIRSHIGTIIDLRHKLEKADDNDHRNPVTGRYEKEPKK